jgi:hypothetical protein
VKRNQQDGNLFLGCLAYPTCRYTEPFATAPTEANSLQAQVVEELLRVQAELREAEQDRQAAQADAKHWQWWYVWVRHGLINLLALMDPEYWEYDTLSLEVTRQIEHGLARLFSPTAEQQALLAQLKARAHERIQQARGCVNPACVGCAERRLAWRDPAQTRDIPCIEKGD